MHSTIKAMILLLLLASSQGCSTSPTRPNTDELNPPSTHPIAILNGYAIEFETIKASLSEYGGDEILREFILDRALEERCGEQGIEITSEQLAHERTLLGATLGFDSDGTLSTDILDDLRANRGLGPIRFERLLRRTAMLRALTRNTEPTTQQIERAIESVYGTRYRVRLFVSEQSAQAHRIRNHTISSPTEAMPWIFAEICAQSSTHPSAPRGGLIESVSPISLGYPSALLTALSATPPGTCSQVISTESGFVVVFVEERIPARSPSQEEREQLIAQLRLDTQRIAMQRLAEELLDQQEVIVMDRALNWAWINRR
tara:strand:- start:11694 stop:12641 length:948 start_codon:yes stop_codon:yes gene_type:complete